VLLAVGAIVVTATRVAVMTAAGNESRTAPVPCAAARAGEAAATARIAFRKNMKAPVPGDRSL
jgi:hypothetical protein